jgi:hypothetical protein
MYYRYSNKIWPFRSPYCNIPLVLVSKNGLNLGLSLFEGVDDKLIIINCSI